MMKIRPASRGPLAYGQRLVLFGRDEATIPNDTLPAERRFPMKFLSSMILCLGLSNMAQAGQNLFDCTAEPGNIKGILSVSVTSTDRHGFVDYTITYANQEPQTFTNKEAYVSSDPNSAYDEDDFKFEGDGSDFDGGSIGIENSTYSALGYDLFKIQVPMRCTTNPAVANSLREYFPRRNGPIREFGDE